MSALSLADALARHEIELSDDQVARLEAYVRLLWEWNEKINLTRHTDHERFVGRDLVDTLAFAEFLRDGETVLDVGTGGGVPGIPLKILRPDLEVVLCESVAKKARVVADIVQRLGLPIEVVHGRAEAILEDRRFDALVVRAVANIRKLLTWFAPHWDSIGRLLLLKGPAWVEERGEARHHGLLKGMALRKLKSYPLPGTDSESVLLRLMPRDRSLEISEESEQE